MSESTVNFNFPLVDRDGMQIASSGLLGSVGFSEKYSGATVPDDPLVVAIRGVFRGEKVDSEQQCLIRSFLVAWLLDRNRKLGQVVAYAVELRQCTNFLSQIGFLDRTATTVGHLAIGIAGIALTWDLMFFEDATLGSIAGNVAAEAVLVGLSKSFEAEIDMRFGEPGTPVKRSKFDINPILVFLQCCHLANVIECVEAEKSLSTTLSSVLEQQIFSLFMLNSRQLEGLACSGTSEATAAVAAHAAIALGLKEINHRDRILNSLEKSISSTECNLRREEASETLKAVRKHGNLDITEIERQLSRQLASASTTEALDLAVVPLRASLQLMSFVAGSMETVTPGQYGRAFEALRNGCDAAKSAAESSPDVLANALNSGISAEAWTRQQFKKACGFLASDKNQTES